MAAAAASTAVRPREDVVARRWEKAWNPIRAEGSGETLRLPLPIFCLLPHPHSLLPRRGRENEGWEEQVFPISGHQREKVWGWGWGWGWSRKLGLEMIWKETRKKCSDSTTNS